jgi:deazaflavin-dependent oxidoreductase (nitroreductase family)
LDWNTQVIEEFRKNKGVVEGQFSGMSLLLLTSTGAKSGKEYVSPLVYTMDGDNYIIAASKGGAPTNPDWYHNLVKNPTATIEVGDQKFTVNATAADEEERKRLYSQHASQYPNFLDYEKSTTRKIPVFVLTKVS